MPRPPRPWFRFYSEATESDKLDDLPDRLVKPWLRLLCLANVTTPRGSLPRMGKIRLTLRVSESKAQAIVNDLVKHGFIDESDDGYMMHDWSDWQYDSDANLTPGRANKNEVARSLERVKNAESPRKEHDARSKRGAEAEREKETEEEADPEAEKEAETDTEPAPSFEAADGRFFREYVRHFQETHAGAPPSPIEQGEARRLERDFGTELCVRAGNDTGWAKHPNWLRKKLEDPEYGRVAARSTSAAVATESPFARYS